MVKKGKPRPYDYHEPKYTKTGKQTKKSKEQLATIRAQKLAEKAADTDYDKVVDLVSFIALTSVLKGGFDVFQWLMNHLNPIPGVTDKAGAIWDAGMDFVDRIIGNTKDDEGEIVEVKYNTTLSQEQVQRLIDESLEEYTKEIIAQRDAWILLKDKIQAEKWTGDHVAERDEVQRQMDILDQALIILNANKPVATEDCK